MKVSRRTVLRNAALIGGNSLVFGLVGSVKAQPPQRWTSEDIPPQRGRVFLITGGNGSPRGNYSGLGYQDALALASKGARVVIASRNTTRGSEAIAEIRKQHPSADVHFEHLDLADLRSVSAFSKTFKARYGRLDVLINNAGTAGHLQREENNAGIERCFATNVVGHYALTSGLLPLLKESNDARIVFVSSSAGDTATIRFNDLQTTRNYSFLAAYSQTKMAVRMLAFELQRRSEINQWPIRCMPVHPGVALTFLIPDGPGLESDWGKLITSNPSMFKPSAQGAWATLYAATSPATVGGSYYGPLGEIGTPGIAATSPYSRDARTSAQLCDVLAQLSGVNIA